MSVFFDSEQVIKGTILKVIKKSLADSRRWFYPPTDYPGEIASRNAEFIGKSLAGKVPSGDSSLDVISIQNYLEQCGTPATRCLQ